ncbi:hypothetical protein DTO166G4_3285 [Paecilomyces variotii]|nr:hypothetical protein DTO166G4_3285 [Paecilomyces variotii]KAJ9237672.1 hypothetical protein DTO166G5_3436 [Paecilomyces variotii]KAJ9261289.1 hypothetical protein DTO195F2_4315 [Paecilomyces variotii]
MARQLSGSFCRDSCRLAPPTIPTSSCPFISWRLAFGESVSLTGTPGGISGVSRSESHCWCCSSSVGPQINSRCGGVPNSVNAENTPMDTYM